MMDATKALTRWSHRHVLDLAAFSRDDFATMLELSSRFRALPTTGPVSYTHLTLPTTPYV